MGADYTFYAGTPVKREARRCFVCGETRQDHYPVDHVDEVLSDENAIRLACEMIDDGTTGPRGRMLARYLIERTRVSIEIRAAQCAERVREERDDGYGSVPQCATAVMTFPEFWGWVAWETGINLDNRDHEIGFLAREIYEAGRES